jgi:hypothetical protein
MKELNLHISQLLGHDLETGEFLLEADGDRGRIEIKVKSSKTEKWWIATSAHEYWIEGEHDDEELDEKVEVGVAIAHLTRCVPIGSKNVDGHFAVVRKIDETHWDVRVLVWKASPDAKTYSALQVVAKS